MLGLDAGVDRAQLRARLVDRPARLEPAEQLRHAMRAHRDHLRAHVMRAGHHVRDDLGVGRIRHRRLEHADHRRAPGAELNRLADHRRIAVERLRPEAIGQDRHAGGLEAFVRWLDQAADDRPQAHRHRSSGRRRRRLG